MNIVIKHFPRNFFLTLCCTNLRHSFILSLYKCEHSFLFCFIMLTTKYMLQLMKCTLPYILRWIHGAFRLYYEVRIKDYNTHLGCYYLPTLAAVNI